MAGFNQHFKSNSRKLCGNDHAGLVILSERICSTAVCYPGPHCSVSDPGSDPCYWCKTLTQGARGARGHRRQTLGLMSENTNAWLMLISRLRSQELFINTTGVSDTRLTVLRSTEQLPDIWSCVTIKAGVDRPNPDFTQMF